MALSSRDQVVSATGRGFSGLATKISSVSLTVHRATSLWNHPGFPAGPAGIPPATAATCSSATRGAYPMPPIVTAGNRLYLVAYSLLATTAGTVQGTVTVYDRAAHMGGIVQNVTTAQTVGLAAPARLSSTVGYIPLLETYSAASTSTQSWTMSYTNSSGVAGRTATLSIPVTTSIGQTAPFILQAGDVGVSSVQTVTLAAASAAAGTVAIVLAKPIVSGPMSSTGIAVRRNFVHTIDVGVDPCLYAAVTVTIAQQPTVTMTYTVVEA